MFSCSRIHSSSILPLFIHPMIPVISILQYTILVDSSSPYISLYISLASPLFLVVNPLTLFPLLQNLYLPLLILLFLSSFAIPSYLKRPTTLLINYIFYLSPILTPPRLLVHDHLLLALFLRFIISAPFIPHPRPWWPCSPTPRDFLRRLTERSDQVIMDHLVVPWLNPFTRVLSSLQLICSPTPANLCSFDSPTLYFHLTFSYSMFLC